MEHHKMAVSDADRFARFLCSNQVPTPQIPWFINWVQRCWQFHGVAGELLPGWETDQKQAFLEHLSQHSHAPQWQVQQAAQALDAWDEFAGLEALRRAAPDTLLQQMQAELRVRHYALRTEEAYLDWTKRYLHFHQQKSPQEVGAAGVRAFLEHLAVDLQVSASTQNQALNALVFLYRDVLHAAFGDLGEVTRARRPQRLPIVLSRAEVWAILSAMKGTHGLMAQLLYGTGMRLMECVRLRIKDVDFELHHIMVRDGKGAKDRIAPLPESVQEDLRTHLERVKALHTRDLAQGRGSVYLPHALARKYPQAEREWGWQYVFPAGRISVDPRSGIVQRHHLDESGLQKAVKAAVRQVNNPKKVNCHAFRHSFATHLLEAGSDIRTVQELLGHAHVSTTMIYTHVLNRPGLTVKSPLDLRPG